MDWIKSRMGTNLKQSTISATLAIVVSAFVLKIEPSNFAKDEIAVFTQSESELFDYVTKAEDFHEVRKKISVFFLFSSMNISFEELHFHLLEFNLLHL